MLVKSALASGLAIGAAQAFLITPQVVPASKASHDVLAPPFGALSIDHTVHIDCPGCPLSAPSSLDDGLTPPPNHLEMAFSIDRSPHGDRLLANGFELYPNPDPFTNSLAAPQVVDGPYGASTVPESRTLGYKLQVYPVATSSPEEGGMQERLDIIRVDLKIIEVGETFVSGIPKVQLDLLKLGDGLTIAKVETVEGGECDTMLCKFRALFGKRPFGGRPCPGKMDGHEQEDGKPAMAIPQGGHRHGHGHGFMQPDQPRPHHGHANAFGLFGTFLMIVTHLLIPILLGIVVGVTTSLIGMAIISVIMRVFAFVRGKNSQAPPSYKANPQEAVVVDEEKDGLMENQEPSDPPPVYGEDVPVSPLSPLPRF